MGNRATLLLVLLAAALGIALALGPHLGVVDRSPIAMRPSAPLAPSGQDGAPGRTDLPLKLSEFTETVDRPLFAADRRPAPEVEEAPVVELPAAVPVTPPPAVELSAVVIDGDRRLALFRTAAGSGSVRAEEGKELEGWTVSEVRPDGVTLERGGVRHEVALRTFKGPPAPVRARAPSRPVKAGEEDKGAQPEVVAQPRPRRPLRGPRRRSIQRRSNQ